MYYIETYMQCTHVYCQILNDIKETQRHNLKTFDNEKMSGAFDCVLFDNYYYRSD